MEKAITEHPDVTDCGVVGVPAEFGEEDVKAYIQLADGAAPDPAAIVEWCEARLASFKIPRYIEFVASFPRTITKQEIARHELRKRGVGDAWDSGKGTRR